MSRPPVSRGRSPRNRHALPASVRFDVVEGRPTRTELAPATPEGLTVRAPVGGDSCLGGTPSTDSRTAGVERPGTAERADAVAEGPLARTRAAGIRDDGPGSVRGTDWNRSVPSGRPGSRVARKDGSPVRDLPRAAAPLVGPTSRSRTQMRMASASLNHHACARGVGIQASYKREHELANHTRLHVFLLSLIGMREWVSLWQLTTRRGSHQAARRADLAIEGSLRRVKLALGG